jgi:protein SCO1/2
MIRLGRFLLACLAPLLAAAAPFDPFSRAGIDSKPGVQVPFGVPFRDESGGVTTLHALARGRPVVLAPVLHNCPNICGVTLGALSDAVARQPRSPDFAVIAFSIDPHETPADAARSIAALAGRAGEDPMRRFHALTGTPEAISTVTGALGYRYAYDPEIGQYAHAAAVAVLTPDGRLVQWLYGLSPDPVELGEAISAAQGGRTGSFAEKIILLCYHYDPKTGRYTLLVDRVLQIAGSAFALSLAGIVLFTLQRERRARGTRS